MAFSFKYTFISLLLGTAVIIGGIKGVFYFIGPDSRQVSNINPKEAQDLILRNQNNPEFVILDVRTPGEYKSGHIKGALMIDYYSRTFKKAIGELDRNKAYLVYCDVGGRSRSVMQLMVDLKFTNLYQLADGIRKWKRDGFQVVN